MDAPEQTAPLYDFLYRDPSRIASYYAQLFRGHLTAVERTDGDRSAKETVGGGSAGIIKAERKATTEASSLHKEVLSPHDIIVTDLLAKLIETKRIDGDYRNAKRGSLVHIRGVLSFADSTVTKTFSSAADDSMFADLNSAQGKSKYEAKSTAKLVKGILSVLTVPSVFLLRNDAGSEFVGTIKEAGLEEPISAYYYKHGSEGLPDTHIVGIKEEATSVVGGEGATLLHATRLFAAALQKMMLPEEALRITPLVIYRHV